MAPTAAELEAESYRCGRYRARTLMDLAGIEVNGSCKFKVTTDSKHKLLILPKPTEL